MSTPKAEKSIADDFVVVVPTIRERHIQEFLVAWQWPCQVIVVEDNPEPTFSLTGCDHYSWQDIARDLGHDEWIIPRRTDCIRSYGYWKAYQTGKPYIVTLDDDCLPRMREDGQVAQWFLQKHANNLQPTPVERWHNTLGGAHPRGYPYEQSAREVGVAISHGLWVETLDLDSIEQLHYSRAGQPTVGYCIGIVPRGRYFPMCGMNLAWRREITSLLYFLLMGQDHRGNRYPFDRFGDIWAGVIAKKILDHLNIGVYSGGPLVRHVRASNVWANLEKERAGIAEHEAFWQWADNAQLWETEPIRCYRQMAEKIGKGQDVYWRTLGRAMYLWSALYE